jgi:hypothetical protein
LQIYERKTYITCFFFHGDEEVGWGTQLGKSLMWVQTRQSKIKILPSINITAIFVKTLTEKYRYINTQQNPTPGETIKIPNTTNHYIIAIVLNFFPRSFQIDFFLAFCEQQNAIFK